MWSDAIAAGGPIMYAVLAAWVVVFAGVLERMFYALGRAARRPQLRVRALVHDGRLEDARRLVAREAELALRNLDRIDGVSQLATSIGLFGTVVGIAQGFLARGGPRDAAASLASLGEGLSTALFTTIAGLVVFLFGQLALLAYREWLSVCERSLPAESLEPLDAARRIS